MKWHSGHSFIVTTRFLTDDCFFHFAHFYSDYKIRTLILRMPHIFIIRMLHILILHICFTFSFYVSVIFQFGVYFIFLILICFTFLFRVPHSAQISHLTRRTERENVTINIAVNFNLWRQSVMYETSRDVDICRRYIK